MHTTIHCSLLWNCTTLRAQPEVSQPPSRRHQGGSYTVKQGAPTLDENAPSTYVLGIHQDATPRPTSTTRLNLLRCQHRCLLHFSHLVALSTSVRQSLVSFVQG